MSHLPFSLSLRKPSTHAAEELLSLAQLAHTLDSLSAVDVVRSHTDGLSHSSQTHALRADFLSASLTRCVQALCGVDDVLLDATSAHDKNSGVVDLTEDELIISERETDKLCEKESDTDSHTRSLSDTFKAAHIPAELCERVRSQRSEWHAASSALSSAFLSCEYRRQQTGLQLVLFTQRHIRDNVHSSALLRKRELVCEALPFLSLCARLSLSADEKYFQRACALYESAEARAREREESQMRVRVRGRERERERPVRPSPYSTLCETLGCTAEDVHDVLLATRPLCCSLSPAFLPEIDVERHAQGDADSVALEQVSGASMT